MGDQKPSQRTFHTSLHWNPLILLALWIVLSPCTVSIHHAFSDPELSRCPMHDEYCFTEFPKSFHLLISICHQMISSNSLQVLKAVKPTVQIQFFRSFNINLKVQILLLATNTVCGFHWTDKLTFFFNSLLDTQIWLTKVCWLLPSKNDIPWEKWLSQRAIPT